jgi:branched-chain amino acid transport system permease protein
VLLVVLVVVPVAVTSPAARFLAVTVLIYAGLAVTWNLTLGVAGIANFAHMAFWAVGAYGFGIAVTKAGISPWLALLVAVGAGALAGVVAFIPVLRLRGIYVALVTFVFAQLCFYLVLGRSDVTGGSSGLVSLPKLALGGTKLNAAAWSGYYWLLAGVLLGVVILLDLLLRSRFGQSLLALRDNERYAIARGVPPFRQQLAAFVISAALAGGIGGIYASVVGVVAPEMFGFGYTTLALSIIFLGGIGSPRGPLVAAVVVVVTSDALKSTGPWRFIVISLIIMAVLWFFPEGLAGLYRRLVRRLVAERSPAERSPVERSPAGRSPAGRSPAERSPAGRSPAERSPAQRESDGRAEQQPRAEGDGSVPIRAAGHHEGERAKSAEEERQDARPPDDGPPEPAGR